MGREVLTGELFAGTPDEVSQEEHQIDADLALARQVYWGTQDPRERNKASAKVKQLVARRSQLQRVRLTAKAAANERR